MERAPRQRSLWVASWADLRNARAAPWYPSHLVVFLTVLLLVQAPRLGGIAGKVAAPVFAPDRGYSDFDDAYYAAAQAIRRDPSQLYRGVHADAAGNTPQTAAPPPFVNLPLIAWLFVPFTLLPLPQAGSVLLLINLVISLTCLLLLQRRVAGCGPAARWAITLACVTSGPLMAAVNLGQTTPLILLLFLMAEGYLRRGHEGRVGLCLGLICLIKIPPLLFLPYFALRWRWRVVASATAVTLLGVTASILCSGRALHVSYYNAAIRPFAGATLAAHNSQSIDAFLARLSTHVPLWSWQPIVLGSGARLVKWLVFTGLLAVCGWRLGARAAISYPGMLLELAIVMCMSLLLSPIYWVHYGTWLLPISVVVGAAVAAPAQQYPRWCATLLAVAVLLINIPVPPPWIVEHFSDQIWFRVLISHHLFGTLLLLGLCIWCGAQLPRVREGSAAPAPPTDR